MVLSFRCPSSRNFDLKDSHCWNPWCSCIWGQLFFHFHRVLQLTKNCCKLNCAYPHYRVCQIQYLGYRVTWSSTTDGITRVSLSYVPSSSRNLYSSGWMQSLHGHPSGLRVSRYSSFKAILCQWRWSFSFRTRRTSGSPDEVESQCIWRPYRSKSLQALLHYQIIWCRIQPPTREDQECPPP